MKKMKLSTAMQALRKREAWLLLILDLGTRWG
jgi:hypothetical protein